MTESDCQVLVVGAGLTGLVLACELLARGIWARIIDKGDGVVLQTCALGIHARTLEVFDMMGLAERFVEHGQVVRRFHMYTDGKTWSAWNWPQRVEHSASCSTSRRT